MFLRFYGLREQPFGVTPNPRFLYHSSMHREALASLQYGIQSGIGFAALIAEPGLGKTTLLFHLLESFHKDARTALIFQTLCTPLELMRYLLDELEVETHEQDPVRLNELFKEVLVKEARAGRPVIIIIDEAQNLDDSVLESVRLLSDFETPRKKLLQIILAGQPGLGRKLAQPNMSQLLQRIAMLTRLKPLGAGEVQKYIDHRLATAGYTGPPLFTPEALALIVEHSHGVPRMINRVCFNAMSIGFAVGKRQLDADVIREVAADLDIRAALEAGSPGDSQQAVNNPAKADHFRISEPGSLPDFSTRQPSATPVPVATSALQDSVTAGFLPEGKFSLIVDASKNHDTIHSSALAATSPVPRSIAEVTPLQPSPLPSRTLGPLEAAAIRPATSGLRPASPKPPLRGPGFRIAPPRSPVHPIQLESSRWLLRLVVGILVPVAILIGWLMWETRSQMVPQQSEPAVQTEPANPAQAPTAAPSAADPQSQPARDKQRSRLKPSKRTASPSGIAYGYGPPQVSNPELVH